MKAVNRQLEEIKKYKIAMEKSKSVYLKNDYAKCIHRLKKELREYCKWRGYNFKEIMKGADI